MKNSEKPSRRPRQVRKPQRDLLPIEGVLARTLKQFGLEEDIARYRFVLEWENIVGAEIARRTKPECIRGGTLIVRVSNSVWAQELSFQRSVILKRLQRFLGPASTVNDIAFSVQGE